ncbi:hypothetical protein OM428_04755 [Enterococcus gallinarum]|nr:hypothetical protein [Enterococcus gallinarum]MCW3744433.1 hypothetical protein [Enterococcus gallinarum]
MLSDSLKKLKTNKIVIAGHTDNVPEKAMADTNPTGISVRPVPLTLWSISSVKGPS